MALDLGVEFAQQLISEVPIEQRAEAWIAHIEQHITTLAKSEHEALAHQLTDGKSLTVVTAAPLPPPTADACVSVCAIRLAAVSWLPSR